MSRYQTKLFVFTLCFFSLLFIRENFMQHPNAFPLKEAVATINTTQALGNQPILAQAAPLDLSISDPVVFTEKAEEAAVSLTDSEVFGEDEGEDEAIEVLDTISETNPEMIVYLTFDDGPSSSTVEILDLLQKYNATATFFMIEPQIRNYPNAMLRMKDEGHALGSHSVSHKLHVFYKSMEQMLNEMDTTAQTIKDITGIESALVRVPYGSSPHMSKDQKAIMTEHGFKIWDWNVDSRDWKFKDGSYVGHTIEQLEKLRNRKVAPVVLLHDLHTTAVHLPRLLSYLVDKGYEFRVIDPSLKEVQF